LSVVRRFSSGGIALAIDSVTRPSVGISFSSIQPIGRFFASMSSR